MRFGLLSGMRLGLTQPLLPFDFRPPQPAFRKFQKSRAASRRRGGIPVLL